MPDDLTLSESQRKHARRDGLVDVGDDIAAPVRIDAQPSPAEAILTPSGRVEHAEGEAKGSAALQSLRTRTVAIDRARGRQRRSDPDAGLEAWQGLVSGRWSLVDQFESDGRRYVVAHRNSPLPRRVLALTLRERQVVAHRVAGHASKVAAYALGISPATVSGALRSAMLKLGVRNVQQLLHKMDPREAVCQGQDGGAEREGRGWSALETDRDPRPGITPGPVRASSDLS
jgi:DNA-binding CsgD family transcriptional regulator